MQQENSRSRPPRLSQVFWAEPTELINITLMHQLWL